MAVSVLALGLNVPVPPLQVPPVAPPPTVPANVTFGLLAHTAWFGPALAVAVLTQFFFTKAGSIGEPL